MNDDIAIKVDHVSKTFKLPHEKSSSVKSALINFMRHKRGYEMQHVLDGISFEIKKGEFFGIVGRNGSGKSTLLKLLAGIYTPTKGSIHVNGKLTPFIELGVGFNPELTGRENVFLNGALLGFNRHEMEAMYDDIVAFAELERFMDQKLKNYSSGMQVRLAFSIAIRAKSDILLIDEVLAVGDVNFQAKCFEYFRTLKSNKQTVVFISHDRNAVREFCNRAALIDSGKLVKIGAASNVLEAYDQVNLDYTEQHKKDGKPKTTEGKNVVAEVTKCEILRGGKLAHVFRPRDLITIRVTTHFKQQVARPVYGLVINRVGENPIFASNTKQENVITQDVQAGQDVVTTYIIKNLLGNGRYLVSPAVASQDTVTIFDWRDALAEFNNVGWRDNYQPVYLDHEIVMGGKSEA